jgi:hypothetical protein
MCWILRYEQNRNISKKAVGPWLFGSAESPYSSGRKEGSMTEYDKAINRLLKSMQKPAPEALYHQLGRLRNEMPHWRELSQASTSRWTGRVLAVVDAAGELVELVALRGYFDFATRNGSSETTGKLVAQQIDTVIAKLELKLPAEA